MALAVALTASLAGAACGPKLTPAENIQNLRDPDPNVRRKSADALRVGAEKGKPPPEAIQPLLDQLKAEPEPKVRGAILITLGASGLPEVKPLLEDAVRAAKTRDEQRWAGRALKYWMINSGAMPETGPWPDGWPFGQPGYPPPLPAE